MLTPLNFAKQTLQRYVPLCTLHSFVVKIIKLLNMNITLMKNGIQIFVNSSKLPVGHVSFHNWHPQLGKDIKKPLRTSRLE